MSATRLAFVVVWLIIPEAASLLNSQEISQSPPQSAQPTSPSVATLPSLPKGTWLNLSLAQSASANWPQGGQDFVSSNFAFTSIDTWSFDVVQIKPTINLKLGASYLDDTTTNQPFRVNDNEVFCEAVISYLLGWRVNPYVSANIRTPITESFNYTSSGRRRIAKLWDPVTSQQAVGFNYTLGGGAFSTRLGISLQQIRALDYTQMTDDPRTLQIRETYKAQSGIEWVTDANVRLDSAISYMGRLGALGSFQQPDVWNLRCENMLRIQVWKFIGVTLGITVAYNVKQSLRTQFKQSLTLGVLQGF